MQPTSIDLGRAKFERLLQRIDNKEPVAKIRKSLDKHSANLHDFLLSEHKIMLLGATDAHRFKRIHDGFCNTIFSYIKRDKPFFGMVTRSSVLAHTFFKFTPADQTMDLYEELCSFKQNYLSRFTEHAIKSKGGELAKCLTITFLTKTDRTALLNLPKNDLKLFSTSNEYPGHLEGYRTNHSSMALSNLNDTPRSPFYFLIGIFDKLSCLQSYTESGSLLRSTWIDMHATVAQLAHFVRMYRMLAPREYAGESAISFDIYKRELLEEVRNGSPSSDFDDDSDLISAIDKETALYENLENEMKKSYNSLKEYAEHTYQACQACYNTFQQSDVYKEYMPKSVDADGTKGYQYHDKYHFYHFRCLESALQKLRNGLYEEVDSSTETQTNFKLNYRVVLASTNIHSKYVDGTTAIAPDGVKLGDELSFLFVDQDHYPEINRFLAENNLEGKVNVLDRTLLDEMAKKIQSPQIHYVLEDVTN